MTGEAKGSRRTARIIVFHLRTRKGAGQSDVVDNKSITRHTVILWSLLMNER